MLEQEIKPRYVCLLTQNNTVVKDGPKMLDGPKMSSHNEGLSHSLSCLPQVGCGSASHPYNFVPQTIEGQVLLVLGQREGRTEPSKALLPHTLLRPESRG